jgi:intracellular septation protein
MTRALVHDATLLAAPGTLSVLRSLNFRTTTISRMKLLIDFFPIILFFVAFKVWGIYTATAVAIAATVAQIAYLRFKTGKIEPMQWMSLGVIVLFGGATLLAHDDNFIKWKPTVLYWLMGGALLIGQLVFKEPAALRHGRAAATARRHLAQTQLGLDRFLRRHGRTQHLGSL